MPGTQSRPGPSRRLERAATALLDDRIFQQEWARRRLLKFTTYTFPKYEVNWHHRVICEALDKLVRGEITRLAIFTPPRHGKSELVSRRLPAYILGRNPDAQIIACSYSSDLAQRMNRDVQRIMDHEYYRQLFPNSRLSEGLRGKDRAVRNSEIFEVVGHRGIYRAAGVGGGITGLGADFAIIDDPVKNFEEAMSATMRDTVWEWFGSTLFSRLEKAGRLLLTMTRWHHDDLAGRILNRLGEWGDTGEGWTVLNLPAVLDTEDKDEEDPRERGEALWPGKYDEKQLKAIQMVQGSYKWEALYQQRPTQLGGSVFKDSWFKTYQVENGPNGRIFILPDDSKVESFVCRFFLTVDLASSLEESADYTVVSVWCYTPTTHLLLVDCVRERIEGPEQLPLVIEKARMWDASLVGIEKSQYQLTMVQAALRAGLPVVELTPKGDKVARAIPAAARAQAGYVLLPATLSFGERFKQELVEFPVGSHDDQVDTLSYAEEMRERLTAYIDTAVWAQDETFEKQSYWNL